MKRLSILIAILALGLVSLVASRSAVAQDLGFGGGVKENLDLPYDAVGESEEDEDAPEIVTFYGTQLEGDGIFYVVDRSSSMAQGELTVAKRELTRNIAEFSSRVQFGIVFFDANITKFPASGQPAEANPGMKASATSFVMATQAGSGSCCQQGLAQALQMANLATVKRKVIVYLGDGRGHCHGGDENLYLKQALGSVTAQNFQRIQINTIMILDWSQIGEDFLKRLAASNGGTYTRKNS